MNNTRGAGKFEKTVKRHIHELEEDITINKTTIQDHRQDQTLVTDDLQQQLDSATTRIEQLESQLVQLIKWQKNLIGS